METTPGPETLQSARLELIPLTSAFVGALVAGEVTAAGAVLGAQVSRSFASDPSHVVQLHLAQQEGEAAGFAGMGRVIVLRSGDRPRRTIGSIGFHGPPDGQRRLEVGCRILPGSRGRGYAAEALTALLAWAAADFDVTRFLVAVPFPRELLRLAPVEMDINGRSLGTPAEGLARLVEGAIDGDFTPNIRRSANGLTTLEARGSVTRRPNDEW